MNGSDAQPEIRINAPAALALMIAAPASLGTAAWGTGCACAEGVNEERPGRRLVPLRAPRERLNQAERECHVRPSSLQVEGTDNADRQMQHAHPASRSRSGRRRGVGGSRLSGAARRAGYEAKGRSHG